MSTVTNGSQSTAFDRVDSCVVLFFQWQNTLHTLVCYFLRNFFFFFWFQFFDWLHSSFFFFFSNNKKKKKNVQTKVPEILKKISLLSAKDEDQHKSGKNGNADKAVAAVSSNDKTKIDDIHATPAWKQWPFSSGLALPDFHFKREREREKKRVNKKNKIKKKSSLKFNPSQTRYEYFSDSANEKIVRLRPMDAISQNRHKSLYIDFLVAEILQYTYMYTYMYITHMLGVKKQKKTKTKQNKTKTKCHRVSIHFFLGKMCKNQINK
ncbi:hypothetical protein RFI_23674 [Reticulomyxa filosa]|uniref:Uncharacterized protein n=1 Tax=Reticulomyxa filosa TaxID=46433 RepID=X6MJR0_RETFI|nr:hypothetical protein RFI_23674 [Reticulomyxa filosa]|eukprot:ETO13692.1 hypothetical protein RFI_23674 [Reticulomyxa filosa]